MPHRSSVSDFARRRDFARDMFAHRGRGLVREERERLEFLRVDDLSLEFSARVPADEHRGAPEEQSAEGRRMEGAVAIADRARDDLEVRAEVRIVREHRGQRFTAALRRALSGVRYR
jgi:hypothetical protein